MYLHLFCQLQNHCFEWLSLSTSFFLSFFLLACFLVFFFNFLLLSLPFFHLKPGRMHLPDRRDFAFKLFPVFNSSLLSPPEPSPNERQASLTLCPPFPAFSSPGFQWLIERRVRFTELGLGFGSKWGQSLLPGQFPYESSWDLFPHFGIPGSTLGSEFSDSKFLLKFPPPPHSNPTLISSHFGFSVHQVSRSPSTLLWPWESSCELKKNSFTFLWGWWRKRGICLLGFEMGREKREVPRRIERRWKSQCLLGMNLRKLYFLMPII